MPGGGKKAVFPPLNLHDHDQVRIGTNDHDRQKKLLQNRGKSLELKEVLEKNKAASGTSKSTEKQPSNGKSSDQQKTPTKSDKALLKLEQQQIKSEQKAQQKLEKEQQKLEKEHQKEQMKLEKELLKEQHKLEKLEKEQTKPQAKSTSKSQDKGKGSVDLFSSLKENPQLKTQKSIDLSLLKHQKSIDAPKQPARKSVDMQYKQDLLNSTDFASSFSSTQVKPKK